MFCDGESEFVRFCFAKTTMTSMLPSYSEYVLPRSLTKIRVIEVSDNVTESACAFTKKITGFYAPNEVRVVACHSR